MGSQITMDKEEALEDTAREEADIIKEVEATAREGAMPRIVGPLSPTTNLIHQPLEEMPTAVAKELPLLALMAGTRPLSALVERTLLKIPMGEVEEEEHP